MTTTLPEAESDSTISTDAIKFLTESSLIPFDEMEEMMIDLYNENKLRDFVKIVLNGSEISDARKLLFVQLLGIRFHSLFSTEAYRGLTLLLGFYTRVSSRPETAIFEPIVRISDRRIIKHLVRNFVGNILRDTTSLLEKAEAKQILSGEPFCIIGNELERIIDEVYLDDE